MPERKNHPALAPTQYAVEDGTNKPTEQQVEEVRKNTGCSVAVALCVSLVASGTVGTLGYLYITKQPPFAPDHTAEVAPQASTVSSTDSASTKPEVPDAIHNNQDLRQALAASHIKATAQDFNFETARPELQAKAIYLTPKSDTDISAKTDAAPADKKYQWKPVSERITRIDQNELLVAVKIINPYITDNAYQLIVPEGLSYRARTSDISDPTIIYFYYNCADKRGADALLGQIGIKDPSKPRQLMWAKSFHLPVCGE